MRIIILKAGWLSSVTLFTIISAWSAPILRASSALTTRSHSTATVHCRADKNDWEEEVRIKAATILQSVFFNETKVEKAVKVGLRPIKNGTLRKRVSQIVLGTSTMRNRHQYIYNMTEKDDNEQENKVRCMVDLHADYLMNTTADDSISWPTDPVERIAVQYSMPNFLVQAWVEEYGVNDTQELCIISNNPGPITLRRNSIRCSSDEKLIQRLESEEKVTLSPPKFAVPGCLRITSGRPKSIWAMPTWKDGWFEVQDVGSQFIVEATDLRADDNILVDYCAGNGGKTLAMLSKLHSLNSSRVATVWAHDVEERRLAQLRGSLSRAGIVNNSNVHLCTTSSADRDLRNEMADVVLVDAPCSSCGVFRRRPSHRWELTQQELENDLPKIQLEILQNASRLVKPGGRLIYATCSLCCCENEHVAIEYEMSESSTDWEPWPFPDAWLISPHRTGTPSHFCKLLPHKHDSDGFFIARWKRKTE